MSRKNKVFLLILAVSLCYINTAWNGFLWDDDAYITNNEQIISLKNSPTFFIPSKIRPYRPLRLLTFSMEYAIFGLRPAIYHIDNVAIHIFNGGLVFWFLFLLVSQSSVRTPVTTTMQLAAAIAAFCLFETGARTTVLSSTAARRSLTISTAV